MVNEPKVLYGNFEVFQEEISLQKDQSFLTRVGDTFKKLHRSDKKLLDRDGYQDCPCHRPYNPDLTFCVFLVALQVQEVCNKAPGNLHFGGFRRALTKELKYYIEQYIEVKGSYFEGD